VHYKYLSTLLLFFSGLLISCENNVQQVKQLTNKSLGVEEAKDVVINYTYGTKPKAKIMAPYMLRHQDSIPFTEFPKTIHADFFAPDLSKESWLDAHYARYMETQNIVYLRDSVRVMNISGDTLYCNELYWNRAKVGHEFYTDKPVRIRTKTHIIDGEGLDAPQDFKEWHITKPKGFVKVPNSQFPG
jgi:hypothetical protein